VAVLRELRSLETKYFEKSEDEKLMLKQLEKTRAMLDAAAAKEKLRELHLRAEERESERTCCVCYGPSSLRNGLECSSANAVKHFFCRDCLDENVVSHQLDEGERFMKQDCKIACRFCTDTVTLFPEPAIAAHVSEVTFARYLQTRDRLKAELAVKTFAEEKAARDRAMTEQQRRVETHRAFVKENILIIRCPRSACKNPIVMSRDFSDCFALSCSYCTCKICGWCLADCGRDAHPHVRVCAESQNPGEIYVARGKQKQSEFYRVRNDKRNAAVDCYIATKVDESDKVEVRRLVTKDLAELHSIESA
jgi:hypothetical protein